MSEIFSRSEVQQSEELVERTKLVEGWLKGWVGGDNLPGAIVGVYNKKGEEICICNVQPKTQSNYDRKTIYRIYSMTKPITTVAAMILIDRGLLSVEDEVSKYIPSFGKSTVYVNGSVESPATEPLKTSIRIYHLLTHTSGISYGIFSNHVCDQILRNNVGLDTINWFRNTPLDKLCDHFASTPLHFQPGTHFLYGFNTDILGRIIEIITGMTLRDFFMKEIFEPLKMLDTDFYVPEDKIDRLANCYEFSGQFNYIPSTSGERDRSKNPSWYSGGGGLVSTLDDYAIFAIMMLNKGEFNGVRIVSAKSVENMTTNHLPDGKTTFDMEFENSFSESSGPGIGFGYGVYVLTDPKVAKGTEMSGVGEYGWGGVASTTFYVDPEKEITAILLTQLIPSSTYRFRSQFRWLTHNLISNN